MRFIMKVEMPIDRGNDAARAGTLASTIEKIVEEQRPEAVYFCTADNGQRNAFIILNIDEGAKIPAYVEPWFLAFGATVKLWPAFTPDEMPVAAADIGRAVSEYA